jgi:hypothetical protein
MILVLPPNAHRVKNRGGEHLDQIRAGQLDLVIDDDGNVTEAS